MPSNHLILCHPLLLLPSIFPSITLFWNGSALRIRWPKYWRFSFNIIPSNKHPGLVSFRMDWLDLLAAQGTLKSLLQHHSSKASILLRSAINVYQGRNGNGYMFQYLHAAWMIISFSRDRLFVTLGTVAQWAHVSLGFSRKEDWSGLPCPLPGDLPDPGVEPVSLMSLALAGRFFTTSTTNAELDWIKINYWWQLDGGQFAARVMSVKG